MNNKTLTVLISLLLVVLVSSCVAAAGGASVDSVATPVVEMPEEPTAEPTNTTAPTEAPTETPTPTEIPATATPTATATAENQWSAVQVRYFFTYSGWILFDPAYFPSEDCEPEVCGTLAGIMPPGSFLMRDADGEPIIGEDGNTVWDEDVIAPYEAQVFAYHNDPVRLCNWTYQNFKLGFGWAQHSKDLSTRYAVYKGLVWDLGNPESPEEIVSCVQFYAANLEIYFPEFIGLEE